MSHGRSFNRFHRWLARRHRRFLRTFVDFELPRDEFLHKYKEERAMLSGT